MALIIVNGIIYDILVVNVAREFGLESKQVKEFFTFVQSGEHDNEEIQKKYNKIMENKK